MKLIIINVKRSSNIDIKAKQAYYIQLMDLTMLDNVMGYTEKNTLVLCK